MSRKRLIPLVLGAGLLVLPALADEIVYFSNGTTMAVESHRITDGVVRVNLGGQAYMAFPLEQIERIETGQGDAPLPTPGAANQMVGGRPRTEAAEVRGTAPSRLRRGAWEGQSDDRDRNENIDVDKSGIAVYRPFGQTAPPNKKRFGVTGRQELRHNPASTSMRNGVVGASRVGSRQVLPPKGGVAARKQQTPIGMAAGNSSPPPPKKKD